MAQYRSGHNGAVLKTVVVETPRRFESFLCRHCPIYPDDIKKLGNNAPVMAYKLTFATGDTRYKNIGKERKPHGIFEGNFG